MAKKKGAETPKNNQENQAFEAELEQMAKQIGSEEKALQELFDETLNEAASELGLAGEQAEKYRQVMQEYKDEIIAKALNADKPGAALLAELHGRSPGGEKIPESKLRSYEHIVESSLNEISQELGLQGPELNYWKQVMLERKNALARQVATQSDATAKLLDLMRDEQYVNQAKAYGNLIEHYQNAEPEEQANILANSEKFLSEKKADPEARAVHQAFLNDVRAGRIAKIKGAHITPSQLPETGEVVSAKKRPEMPKAGEVKTAKKPGGIMGWLKRLFG